MDNNKNMPHETDIKKYIIYHHLFQDEFYEILKRSGEDKKFIKAFQSRLRYLAEKRKECVLHGEWFESLKYVRADYEVYSMKFKTIKKNPRILFCIEDDPATAILLFCFSEKGDKDYKKGIEIAIERFEEWKKEE